MACGMSQAITVFLGLIQYRIVDDNMIAHVPENTN
jgi:hypothetical protein